MATVEMRIREVAPRINEILHEYDNANEPPVYALREEAAAVLGSKALYQTYHLSSRYVLPHYKNRYGDGIVPSHAHHLAISFCTGGFSMAEIGTPWAAEVPPAGHWRRKKMLEFAARLVEESTGKLPPHQEEDCKIASYAKSHSSMQVGASCSVRRARIQKWQTRAGTCA